MKSLPWEIIKGKKDIKNTVWEKIDDTKVKLNLDLLDDKFSRAKPKPKVEEKKKTVQKVEKKSFLEDSRLRMMNIVLGKLRLDPLEISEAMEQYDINILTPENCDLILPLMPTKEESKKVADFSGDPLTELATADQFVLVVSGIIGYKERIQSLLFQSDYLDKYLSIMNEINKFSDSFKFLREDKNFKKFLEMVLAYGNIMNGGSSKGASYGFPIDNLLKLQETKDKNNKNNLIDFFVEIIHEKYKDEKMIETIEKNFKLISELQPEQIEGMIKDLTGKFASVKKLKQTIEKNKDQLMEEDKSESFLKDFYNDAEEKVSEVNEKFEKIKEEFSKIRNFLAIKSDKVELPNFIDVFTKLSGHFNEAENKYLSKKEKENKKSKKKI